MITGLYLFTNVWQELGPAGWARFISPFYYFDASRALVPGYGLDLPAAAALLAMTALLIGAAAWAFQRRDYAAALWSRRAGRPGPGTPGWSSGRYCARSGPPRSSASGTGSSAGRARRR